MYCVVLCHVDSCSVLFCMAKWPRMGVDHEGWRVWREKKGGGGVGEGLIKELKTVQFI